MRTENERRETLVVASDKRSVLASSRVAVLAPCYNEAATIGKVVADFRAALPGAEVYVYDNNSTDGTADAARASGAVVRQASFQGKGNVVRSMFADIDADIYVLVDGDGTYDSSAAPSLVGALVDNGLDMVSSARVSTEASAYRPGHRMGNRLLTGLVGFAFGRRFQDMLTGYRVFSRRFVKSFPAASGGFEIETELTVHALQMRLPALELPSAYGSRPEGSASKLNTIRDGVRILRMIGLLLRDEKPLQFFSTVTAAAFCLAIILGGPVVFEYFETGLVPRLPTLIVGMGLCIVGLLSFACGLILDAVARARLEQRRFAYLAQRALFQERRREASA